jgi:deoxyribodipyrimidine photo-lyase
VFTPFWRRVQALGDPPKPLPAPKTLKGVADLAGDRLEDWKLEPTRPDWAGGLRDNWKPARPPPKRSSRRSSTAALPAIPAIATGPTATAPRGSHRIFVSAKSARARSGTPHALRRPNIPRLSADIEKFLSELGWREFCRHLLFDVPDLATRNLAALVRQLSMEARCQSLARMAARPDRLSHRRCRHA